jgi:hypothetical protein
MMSLLEAAAKFAAMESDLEMTKHAIVCRA